MQVERIRLLDADKPDWEISGSIVVRRGAESRSNPENRFS
jgi:hypothetical protein